MQIARALLSFFAAGALACAVAACGAGSIEASSVTDTPTPVPTPFNGHLYVEYASTAGSAQADGIAVYALPLQAQSKPLFTIAQPAGPLAFDLNGNLYTTPADRSSIIEARLPLSASSTFQTVIVSNPAAIPPSPVSVSDLGFDQNGNLWVLTTNDIREFVPPLSPASVAATVNSSGGTAQMIFSPSGKIYAGPMSVAYGSTATLEVYNSFPYTVPPKAISNVGFGVPMAFFPDGTGLSSTTGANIQQQVPDQIFPPGLEIVPPSISASTTSLFVVPFQLGEQGFPAHPGAIDQNGTVYVLNGHAGNAISVFTYPLSAQSRPAFSLPCVAAEGSCVPAVGVYIGP